MLKFSRGWVIGVVDAAPVPTKDSPVMGSSGGNSGQAGRLRYPLQTARVELVEPYPALGESLDRLSMSGGAQGKWD